MENIENVDAENTTPEIDEKLIGDIVEKRLNEIANKNKDNKKSVQSNDTVEDDSLEVETKIRNLVDTRKALSFYTAKSVSLIGKASNVTTGTAGGNIANPAYGDQFINIANQYGIARKMCDIQFVPGKSLAFPKETTGITSYIIGEAASLTASQPVFAQVTLTPKKIATITPVTNELLKDASYPVLPILTQMAAKEFARQEDTQLFTGSGTFTGITNTAGINTVTASATGIITSTTVKAVLGDDIRDMITAVESQNTNWVDGAGFYMHASVKGVISKLKDSQGNYIFNQGSPNLGFPDTLFGYPVYTTNALTSTSTTTSGTKYIVFGNLKNVMMGDRMELELFHGLEGTVGSDNLLAQDMSAFRFIERIDFQVAQAGAFATYQTQ